MSEAKHSPLLPCPFCGSANVDYSGAPGKGYHVECLACLARSGWGDYGYQAAAKWNTRASAVAEPATVSETCSDCGAREPCDDDCPNYAEPAAAPAAAPTREETIDLTLTADFTKSLPGGALDDSAYEQIESALDEIDAPLTDSGRYMTLVERILALKSAPAK